MTRFVYFSLYLQMSVGTVRWEFSILMIPVIILRFNGAVALEAAREAIRSLPQNARTKNEGTYNRIII